jgi:hypothetical protein
MGNTPCFGLADGCKGNVLLKLSCYSLLPSHKEGRDDEVLKQLLNNAWTSDIQRTLTIGLILEYIQLWDILMWFSCSPKWRILTFGN